MRSWAALVLLAMLAACAPNQPRSAQLRACQVPVAGKVALTAKVTRCGALIRTSRGDERLAAMVAQAEGYRLLGDQAAALQDLDAVLAARSNDADALDGRGRVFADQNDLARARADLEAAVADAPDDSEAYNDLGVVLRQEGDLKGALHAENRAIELDPGGAHPWINRGRVMVAMRRFEMGLADFRQAIEINADSPAAYEGVAEADLGKHDVPGALAAYNQASQLHFDNANYDRAVADTSLALQAKPDDPETLNNRCWDRAVENVQLDQALADCQRSLQLRPNVAYVIDSEAFVHFRMGQYAAAISGYDAALAQDPKLAPSLFMRGVAKLKSGDRGGGEHDIRSAENMDGTVAPTFAAYGITPQ
jgi:tetratricopeptide (TPR) repeat protein